MIIKNLHTSADKLMAEVEFDCVFITTPHYLHLKVLEDFSSEKNTFSSKNL